MDIRKFSRDACSIISYFIEWHNPQAYRYELRTEHDAKDSVIKIHIYLLVILHAADSMLIERAAGKRVDPKTGDIYHTTFDWPTENNIHQRLIVPPHNTEEDLVNRLMEYNRNIGAIQDSLKATVKVVNVDQPKGDVFNQSNERFMLIKKNRTSFFKANYC